MACLLLRLSAFCLVGAVARSGAGFVVIAEQRTGSTWLVQELNMHPCLVAGREVFLNEKGRTGNEFVWSQVGRRRALEALFGEGPPVLHNTSHSFDALRARCDGAPSATCGFKWMLSQHVTREYEWFGPLCERLGVRLLFLKRRNLLRVLLSSTAKDLQGSNPRSEAPQKAYVDLATGAGLLSKLGFLASRDAEMDALSARARAARIPSLTVTYEDLMQNRSALDEIALFALDSDAASHCASVHWDWSFTTAGAIDHSKVIHAAPMSTYVHNWGEVVRTLEHTPFERFLDETR